MKWMIWVEPNQTFIENYPDGWTSAEVERAANNRYGGKVTCVSPAPSRGSHESYSSSGGGSGSSGGGVGCAGIFWIVVGIVALGVFGGGEGEDSSPSTPQQSYNAPVERVVPAAPEPQWEDYATPPPSYCVNENFEPC